MYRYLFLVYAMLALSVSCSQKQSKSVDNTIKSGVMETEGIMELPETMGRDDFALDLFRTVNRFEKDGSNVLVSPLSVRIALSMVANGAQGVTRDEILEAIGLQGYTMEQINAYSLRQTAALTGADSNTVVSIANSLWYRDGVNIYGDFRNTLERYYSASATALDFGSRSSVNIINGWCAENTNGKITKIIEDIPADAILYLINAVYFKGLWSDPFDGDMTRDAPFHGTEGTQTVKMMNKTAQYGYFKDGDFVYVELPYGDNKFSMIVALPNEGRDMDELLQSMDRESLETVFKGLFLNRLSLGLPRFTMTGSYRLEQTALPAMGIRRAFSSGADFALITGDMPLNISTVIHETFVEVDEKGTEAAAVTAVGITRTSVQIEQPVRVTVDRPFLFFVRERGSDTILFAGRVNNV